MVFCRDRPLPIWGPSRTQSMTRHLVEAFAFDIRIREAAPDQLPGKGVEIDAKEVTQGEIYNDGLTRVSAFLVDHGTVKPAFGYRVDSAGHSVVISGDTKFCQNLVDFAGGADCLIHAAWSAGWKNPTPPSKRSIASARMRDTFSRLRSPSSVWFITTRMKKGFGMRYAKNIKVR
jgi:uncharacterized protein with von Willebrand factor type A (vWA) domain